MGKRILFLFALNWLFFAFILAGCSTTNIHIMKLTSIPGGSTVILDGKSENRTPTKIALPLDNQDHYLYIKREGCSEVRKVFANNQYPNKLTINLDCSAE